jgi:hypothetical protein
MEEHDDYIQPDFSNIAYYDTDYESPGEPYVMKPIGFVSNLILAAICLCVVLAIAVVALNK